MARSALARLVWYYVPHECDWGPVRLVAPLSGGGWWTLGYCRRCGRMVAKELSAGEYFRFLVEEVESCG